MRGLRVDEATFRRLTLVVAVALAVIVVTGGAVRLTSSGLGCPDWPRCSAHSYTAALSFHPLVEFVNRIVSFAVGLAVAAVAVASLLLVERRRDLVLLSWGLVLGFIGQAVLGGLTVLYHLAPQLVMAHFLLSMVLLWVALVLRHRAGPGFARGSVAAVRREVVLLARLVAVMAAIVLFVGTMVTGSGPHSGSTDVRRLGIHLATIAPLHADLAMFLCGLVAATAIALHLADAPKQSLQFGHLLVALVLFQAGIGFLQYFLHLPAGLVEVHIAGATAIWATTILLNLSLFVPAPAGARAPVRESATVLHGS